MPAKKRPGEKPGQQSSTSSSGIAGGRKPWKKKTPVEVFFGQEEKLRQQVEEAEADLQQKREQLKKFEQARKIFEAS
jgi:hypothetical protein